MATNDTTRLSLVVNNPVKPSGDTCIPPKGTQLHLAWFDEAENIAAVNEAMKRSPGIHALATKLNGNLLMQRLVKAALTKAKAKARHPADEELEG